MNKRFSFLLALVMMFALLPATPLLAAGKASVASGQAQSGKLYRYKGAHGQTVIDGAVPPEFARNGYEVLNAAGQVIEVVPRQLSAEELANLSVEEKAQRAAKENEAKQQAYDESLLLRYSDVTDIEAARGRSIKELDIRVAILRGNMMQVKANLEREQQRAADIERGGREVSKDTRATIDQLRKATEVSENDIEQRKREIDDVRNQYQKEIERFRYLTEVKGYRR